VLWALDHASGGRAHSYAWSSAADLRNPIGWLAWRLGHWRAPDGGVPAGPLPR
jgi:hypothetical protein